MEILRKEMKLKGFTIKTLAKTLGVTTANIHGWFNGSYRPSVSSISRLQKLGFSDAACLEPSKDIEV